MLLNKDFKSTKERIDFIIENKSTLLAGKKAEIKKADGISHIVNIYSKDNAIKANEIIDNYQELSEIKIEALINTTNVIDSHQDLHVKGIWNKTVKENRNMLHLAEHKMDFDNIISDGQDLKASVKEFDWRELGYDFEGKTEALLFESTVKRGRNQRMFDQYAKGFVKNHSVGMQYIKLELAVNDESYQKEFETYNKYIDLAINPEKAEELGYFWVVQEAKAIEGSAVPIGSNTFTPTTNNNKQPSNDTAKENEPSPDTQLLNKLNNLLTKI